MLVPHDPTWPEQFERAAARIRRAGDPSWDVEHIGSTAVPGLCAKPVIDLAVRVEDDDDFRRHLPGLSEAGWRASSGVRSHPVLVLEDGGVRTHIAHFFTRSAWSTVHQRLFRDWLLAHPADARRYEATKRLAAEAGSYSAAKTVIVQELVDRARADLGLPPVDVRDK